MHFSQNERRVTYDLRLTPGGRRTARSFSTRPRYCFRFGFGTAAWGVVVAAGVAHELKLPLDVLVVRKIGHPLQPEFAVGALAEPDSVFLNEESLASFPVATSQLYKIVTRGKERLHDYRRRFHLHEIPALDGKVVLLVDDGLATGATVTEAAQRFLPANSRRSKL